jgi:hypothetical protein
MKIRPLENALFHEHRQICRQTDRHDEANILFFRNFANEPKNLRQWAGKGGLAVQNKLACYTFDTPNLENSVTVLT